MKLIHEQGYDVAVGKMGAYQAWMQENEGELAKACPPGIEYLGTYAVIYGTDRQSGGCRTLFQYDSYGSQDALAEAMRTPGKFRDLMEEAMSFGDWRNDANGCNVLMKAIVDTSIIEPTD